MLGNVTIVTTDILKKRKVKNKNWRYAIALLLIIAAVVATCNWGCSPQANKEQSEQQLSAMRETALSDTVKLKNISGFFVITDWSFRKYISDTIISTPQINGVAVRCYWKELNPAPGMYDWRRLDSIFNQCVRLKRQISLQVVPGCKSPAWVFAKCPSLTFYEYEHIGRLGLDTTLDEHIQPIPWDTGYANEWIRFIAVLGSHCKSNPEWWTRIVSVNVTGVSRTTEEFRLPMQDTINREGSYTSHASELWASVGYTPAKILTVQKLFNEAWAKAFPRRLLCMSFITQSDFPLLSYSPTDSAIYQLQAQYGSRALFKYTSLTSSFKPINSGYNITRHEAIKRMGGNFGFQLSDIVYSGGDSPTLDSALFKGISYGADFIEVSPGVVSKQSDILSKYKSALNQK